MRTFLIVVIVLSSFTLFGQYNPDKRNVVRLGASYGGFSGLEFHLGVERNITPRQVLYGNIFSAVRDVCGLTLGYRYNAVSYKWIEAFVGLGLRTGYYGGGLFKSQNYIMGLHPNLELRMNVNKMYFISTGVQLNSILGNSLDDGNEYFINTINLGVARRF